MQKFLAGAIIALSAILIIVSLAGTGAAWFLNGPLTRDATSRLTELDNELDSTQAALRDTKTELERALRIVGTAEQTLTELKDELDRAKQLLGSVDVTLEGTVIPGLEGSQDKINALKVMLENLRQTLQQINNLPFIDLNVPGEELLTEIISGIDVFNAEIGRATQVVERASTSLEDITYLMGGDLSETQIRLQKMLEVVQDYDEQITDWRAQVHDTIEKAPGWIDQASIILTVFFLWFGFSQFALLLFGLTWWQGGDPLAVLRTIRLPPARPIA